jgi:malate synthase
VAIPDGAVTPDGLAGDVGVAIRYLESWLRGVGAAAIDNLMEDAATAEIARSQVWQWLRHGRVEREQVADAQAAVLGDAPGGRFAEAAELFEEVALGDDLVEFLTLPGYERLN